jgi:hypothetical protein
LEKSDLHGHAILIRHVGKNTEAPLWAEPHKGNRVIRHFLDQIPRPDERGSELRMTLSLLDQTALFEQRLDVRIAAAEVTIHLTCIFRPTT